MKRAFPLLLAFALPLIAVAGQVSTPDAHDGAAAEAEGQAFADAGRREAAIRPGGRNASPLPSPKKSPPIVVPQGTVNNNPL